MQFQLIARKAPTSKSLHFNNGSVFLCVDGPVIGSTILHPHDENQSLQQQFSRIITDFDSSKICPGVHDEKYAGIKFCAGAVSEKDFKWKSVKYTTIYAENGKTCCSSCFTVKLALGRLVSKVPILSSAEKLTKLKFDYRMAKQKLDRKEHQLTVG